MNKRRRFPLSYLIGILMIGAMAVLLALFLIGVQPGTTQVAVPKDDVPAYALLTTEDFILVDVVEGENTPSNTTLTAERLNTLTEEGKLTVFASVPLLQGQTVDTRLLSNRPFGSFSLVLDDEKVVSISVPSDSAIASVLQPGMVVDVSLGNRSFDGDSAAAMMAKVIAFGPAKKIAEDFPSVDTGALGSTDDAGLVALLAVGQSDAIPLAENSNGAIVLVTGCRIKDDGRIVPADPARPEACLVPADRAAGTAEGAAEPAADDMSMDDEG